MYEPPLFIRYGYGFGLRIVGRQATSRIRCRNILSSMKSLARIRFFPWQHILTRRVQWIGKLISSLQKWFVTFPSFKPLSSSFKKRNLGIDRHAICIGARNARVERTRWTQNWKTNHVSSHGLLDSSAASAGLEGLGWRLTTINCLYASISSLLTKGARISVLVKHYPIISINHIITRDGSLTRSIVSTTKSVIVRPPGRVCIDYKTALVIG